MCHVTHFLNIHDRTMWWTSFKKCWLYAKKSPAAQLFRMNEFIEKIWIEVLFRINVQINIDVIDCTEKRHSFCKHEYEFFHCKQSPNAWKIWWVVSTWTHSQRHIFSVISVIQMITDKKASWEFVLLWFAPPFLPSHSCNQNCAVPVIANVIRYPTTEESHQRSGIHIRLPLSRGD